MPDSPDFFSEVLLHKTPSADRWRCRHQRHVPGCKIGRPDNLMHPARCRSRIQYRMSARSVLLIGGNSGIGNAAARLLVAEGWSVRSASRSAGPLAELGIPTQHFDAEKVPELEIPEVVL